MGSKAEAMSFFKKLGNNSNSSSSNNSSSSSSSSSSSKKSSTSIAAPTTTSSTITQTTPLKNRSQSTDGLSGGNQSWIFNLKLATYKSIEAKVGSKVTLNIKNRQNVQLKKGDRFFFSISTPNKVKSDRIVSQSTVTFEPLLEVKSKDHTFDVVVQFEKIFTDPIPRTIFENHPSLHDLVSSNSSFTKIPDSQYSLFLDLVSNYSSKTVKKEAINFLSGISLDNRKDSNASSTSTTTGNLTPNLNINTPLNSTPSKEPLSLDGRGGGSDENPIDGFSLQSLLENNKDNSIIDKQIPIQQTTNQDSSDNSDTNKDRPIGSPVSLPPNLLSQIQQRGDYHNNNNNNNNNNYSIPPQPHLQYQQPPPKHQISQLQLDQQQQLPQQSISKSIKKRNTIEEYNLNYNLSVPQKIVFVTNNGHPFSVFSLIKGESRKTKLKISKKDHHGDYSINSKKDNIYINNNNNIDENDSDNNNLNSNINNNNNSNNSLNMINGSGGNIVNNNSNNNNLKDSNNNSNLVNITNNNNLKDKDSNSNLKDKDSKDNSNNNNNSKENKENSNKDNELVSNQNYSGGGGGGFYISKDTILSNLGLNGKKEISYAHLLNSDFDVNDLIGDELDVNGVPLKYDPTFLDNSELKTGKHRTVMNLPSYKVSIFPFIKKGAIKEELNEQFRQKHQWINQPGITLYKIRKIKRKLKKITIQSELEISTLGLAFVLIEKLIMKNLISRSNFKLYASACLLLAAKFNDTKAMENAMGPFFDQVEKRFDISKKELLSSEFSVFSQLSFSLFVSQLDVLPHLNRLKSEANDEEELIF